MPGAGQQQLLAVARVLLRRPHVVLLDECSASVDRHVAAQMQDALRSHLADSTIIQVLAHLESMIIAHLLTFIWSLWDQC